MNYYKVTEKFLYNYNALKISIENMESELKELEPVGTSGIDYSGEKLSPTYKIVQMTENEAMRIINQIESLEESIKKTTDKIERIDKGLKSLSDTERELIKKRYFNNQQWYEIAYDLKYSEFWCREIRKRAINKIAVSLFGVDVLEDRIAN